MSNGLTQIRNRAFISYSRKDKKYLDELHSHMAFHVREGMVSSWDDRSIVPGDRWKDEIIQAVNSTKVAVFLVSADFLASKFIAKNELFPLLKAAEEEGVVVLSVILGSCVFKDTPLAAFQAINEPSNPLNRMSLGKRDAIWSEVAEFIKVNLQADK
jgi:hypothetical protein